MTDFEDQRYLNLGRKHNDHGRGDGRRSAHRTLGLRVFMAKRMARSGSKNLREVGHWSLGADSREGFGRPMRARVAAPGKSAPGTSAPK